MFSLGWMEISIILIITIVVVGPKEIPTVIRFIKGMTSGIRKMSKEFTSTVDELTNLDEVKDIKKEILDTKESEVEALSSSDIFFLNDLIPLAMSPIKVGILPFPNNKRTMIKTIIQCQILKAPISFLYNIISQLSRENKYVILI